MMNKAFAILIQVFLSLGAILFVKQTLDEYLEENTIHTKTQEPLTLHDLPALTICWGVVQDTNMADNPPATKDPQPSQETLYGISKPLNYGKDFIIDLKMIEKDEHTITLLQDEYVQTSDKLRIHLMELFHRKAEKAKKPPCYEQAMITRRQCFKIDKKWQGEQTHNFQNLRLQLALKFNGTVPKPHYSFTTITSEENS